ncbi:MAG: hypothetical protein KDM81_03345 [Verrucomicrobiae bacterium]|nr:hypothetical protein [Verrucomicrobiae bacterium]
MRNRERGLRLKRPLLLKCFLRYVGSVSLLALVAVAMPHSWMDATHRWLGLGEMPSGPIVGYLTRTLSAFYALLGGLLWVLSFDLKRHLPVLRYVAWAMIGFGGIALIVDWQVGLPWHWTVFEGPMVIAFGKVILWLARSVSEEGR